MKKVGGWGGLQQPPCPEVGELSKIIKKMVKLLGVTLPNLEWFLSNLHIPYSSAKFDRQWGNQNAYMYKIPHQWDKEMYEILTHSPTSGLF